MRTLKSSLFLAAITVALVGVLASNAHAEDVNATKAIVGTWQGYHQVMKDTISFVFNKDGTGKTLRRGDTLWNFRYALHEHSKPIGLDIIVAGQGKALAIIEFSSANSMRIKMGLNVASTRPSGFPAGKDDETVNFERKQ